MPHFSHFPSRTLRLHHPVLQRLSIVRVSPLSKPTIQITLISHKRGLSGFNNDNPNYMMIPCMQCLHRTAISNGPSHKGLHLSRTQLKVWLWKLENQSFLKYCRILSQKGRLVVRRYYESGSIARKQRVRRKLREKTPKEISTNFVRNTSVIVGKTVQKAKGALSMVKVSTEHLGKIVKGFGGGGHKSEGENGGDELHKNTHDIHEMGIEGAKNLDLRILLRQVRIDPKNEIGGRDGSDMVGGYDNGRRRQTWTNLSSVLMDSDMQDAGVDGHNVENEELATIEEICETSPCARRPSGQRNEVSEIPALEKLNLRETEAATKDDRATRDAQKIKRYLESLALALKAKTAAEQRESIDYSTPVQEPISPDRQPLLDSFDLPSSQTIIHKSSIESLISHGSPFPTNWDTVSDLESNANKSLRQLSPATQDIFNVTHAATMCYSATSDQILDLNPFSLHR